MDNGQNNQIIADSEQAMSSVTDPLNDNTQEKQLAKSVKFKKIFLTALLFFLALPFLLTDLRMESSGVGSVIFLLSIILIAICGIGYIFTLIKSMLLKKKANTAAADSGFRKKEILCLPLFIALYSLTAFIADGASSALYGFLMLEIYFIIAFAILMLDLLMGSVKRTLKTKKVQISLITFVPEFFMATIMDMSVLPVFAVCALLAGVASTILYKKPEKLTNHPLTKKQFLRCLSVTAAVFVLFGALSVVSPIVTAKRIDKMSLKLTKDLAGKIFVTEDTDAYDRAYVFDTDGKYHYVTEDYTDKDKRSISADADWFGFGTLRSTSRFDGVSYDKDGNAVSLITNNYDNTQTVYNLSDSVPCFKHKFGEYVTLKVAVSCQEPGSRKRICEKCGYEEISKIEGQHKYSNGTCILCGEKKPSKKSDVDANSWYTYTPLPQLKIQNCEIYDATVSGGGKRLLVSYYPVCSHCHAVGTMSIITVGDEQTRFYVCPECDGSTTVVFKIAY